jgi:hypothetical protein
MKTTRPLSSLSGESTPSWATSAAREIADFLSEPSSLIPALTRTVYEITEEKKDINEIAELFGLDLLKEPCPIVHIIDVISRHRKNVNQRRGDGDVFAPQK